MESSTRAEKHVGITNQEIKRTNYFREISYYSKEVFCIIYVKCLLVAVFLSRKIPNLKQTSPFSSQKRLITLSVIKKTTHPHDSQIFHLCAMTRM